MPTSYAPFTAAPEDEEDGFSAGLTRDMQSVPYAGTPEAPLQPMPGVEPTFATPAAAPSATSAPQYTPPDRTELQRWEHTLQTDQQPTDRGAYKPKWWEQGLGRLGAGMLAFGGDPNAVEKGAGAINRRYNNAEIDRQGRVRSDQAGLQAAQGSIAQQQQDFTQRERQFNNEGLANQRNEHAAEFAAQEKGRLAQVAPSTLQPVDPKNPLGSWQGQTIGGEKVTLNQPPDSWLKTPAGVSATREADVQRLGLKGDEAKFYRANGKLKEPGQETHIHIPSAEAQTYSDWKSAFTRDNKRPPTANEIIAYRRNPQQAPAATPYQLAELGTKRDAEYQKINDDAQMQFEAATTNEEKDRITADHNAKLAQLATKWNELFSQADPSGRNAPAAASASPAALPNPQAARAPAAAPAQQVQLPPQAIARLKPGVETTFGANGTWTLINGQPTRVR